MIERLAHALDTDPNDLLRAAGRYASGTTFEETVLNRLDSLSRDVRAGFQRLDAAIESLRAEVRG